MTTLPRSLARWQRQLTLFPHETATILGGWVRRLAPAFDALASSQQEPSGEVDGFDGIGNRGQYERLLTSEWMLQKYAPLEFLRRAANAELSFFQLALRRPVSRERTLVLFDAGPDQLGDCRLAQLALLVLLEQRAQSRGHELCWQHLHRFGEGTQTGLDEQAVQAFLRHRTPARSSFTTWQTWSKQAGNQRIWLIGPAAVTAFGGSAFARVTLRERVSHERFVDVHLESGLHSRRVELALPDPDQSARLIRDPFQSARAPLTTSDTVGSTLLLSQNGKRLFYRNAAGELIAQSIPNSPREKPTSVRRYKDPSGGVICSVADGGRKVFWLARDQNGLSVRLADQRRHARHSAFADTPPANVSKLTPLVWYPNPGVAIFESDDATLWRADLVAKRCEPIAQGVRSWLRIGERHFVAVARCRAFAREGSCVLELKSHRELRPIVGPDANDARLRLVESSSRVILLNYATEQGGVWDLRGYAEDAGKWKPVGSVNLHAPSGTSVLGIVQLEGKAGLWLLEADRREVGIVRLRSARSVLKTTSPIVHASVATSAPLVAVATENGELLVANADGTVRYRGKSQ